MLASGISSSPATAQPSTAATPAASGTKSEQEFLVPPGGGAYDVPIHAETVCILSFFEKVSIETLKSSPLFTVESWGAYGVGVRAAPPLPDESQTTLSPTQRDEYERAREEARRPGTFTTLALKTETRAVRINVTFRVVPLTERAFTMVSFRAVSEEEARLAFVESELEKRMAPIRAEMEALRKRVDENVRDRAELLVMDRALTRSEISSLSAHERNDANVVAHVTRSMVLGEHGYLFFEIENRGRTPFRLARVEVTTGGNVVSGRTRLASATIDKDPKLIGVVHGGATARGAVIIPSVDGVLNKPLSLTLSDPDGRGAIRITRRLVLK
jgi:hypothetical protein